MSAIRLVFLGVLVAVVSCGGSDAPASNGGQTSPAPPSGPSPPSPPSPPPPPATGSTTTEPVVPASLTPPVGVTWHVGVTDNVSLATLQGIYASLVAANNALWKISEGQVRVHKIVLFDAVGPGVTARSFIAAPTPPFDTSNLDIVVFPSVSWDVPASGAVASFPGLGRAERIMIIPVHARTFVWIHEASHLMYRLTWSAGPLLTDEYQDGVQDAACVMESERLPQRWCSDRNHASQTSQPHSCWRQILADYPRFLHSGNDTASGLPAVPIAEYHDTP